MKIRDILWSALATAVLDTFLFGLIFSSRFYHLLICFLVITVGAFFLFSLLASAKKADEDGQRIFNHMKGVEQ